MLSAFRIAPLLLLPVILFILVAATAQGDDEWTRAILLNFDMVSGARWSVSFSDLIVFASLLILFVEIVKAVNTEAREIINHGLSMIVALVCIILFITNPRFTNSAFFLITAMTLVDVVAGFAITIVAARRDIGAQSPL
jgi:hypothetical protein